MVSEARARSLIHLALVEMIRYTNNGDQTKITSEMVGIGDELLANLGFTEAKREAGPNICQRPEGCDSPTRCQSGCTHTEDK